MGRRRNTYPHLNLPPRPAVEASVSVRVDLLDLEDWRPEQIDAFLRGVGRVVAASQELPKPAAPGATP